jgi:hypothetical protein
LKAFADLMVMEPEVAKRNLVAFFEHLSQKAQTEEITDDKKQEIRMKELEIESLEMQVNFWNSQISGTCFKDSIT